MTRYAVCLFLLLSASGLPAQQSMEFLPDGNLPRLLIDPLEPQMGVRLMGVSRSASRFGTGVEWEANFGHMIPFVRLSGTTERGVTLGVQGGVFGRFSFETRKRDLISADWIFALPLFIIDGHNFVRIRYRHISSHLGDDYINRFNVAPEGYLRDAIGVLVYREVVNGVGLYGGGNAAFNVDPDTNNIRRLALTGGIELNRYSVWGRDFYGGADVYLDQDMNWRPRVNLHIGERLTHTSGRNLRFVGELLFGPSPQGEFRRRNATLWKLGLIVDL